MTAPIDIECPRCKAIAGLYCTTQRRNEKDRRMSIVLVDYHHAERVDAWARVSSVTHLPQPSADVRKPVVDLVSEGVRLPAVGSLVIHSDGTTRVVVSHFDYDNYTLTVTAHQWGEIGMIRYEVFTPYAFRNGLLRKLAVP